MLFLRKGENERKSDTFVISSDCTLGWEYKNKNPLLHSWKEEENEKLDQKEILMEIWNAKLYNFSKMRFP